VRPLLRNRIRRHRNTARRIAKSDNDYGLLIHAAVKPRKKSRKDRLSSLPAVVLSSPDDNAA
jgi:hypothetical protein